MKKLYLALAMAGITFGSSAFAFEGSIVKVPASNDHFFVGLEGLYLQASDTNGDLDYANIASRGATGTSLTNNSIESVDTSYQWAWRFWVGYQYGAANDVSLGYFRLRNSDSDNIAVTTPSAIFNPNDSFVDSYISAYGSVDYEVDQVDLTLGQKINPVRCITLHPFGGLRWAQVKRDLHSDFTTTASSFVTHQSDHSNFSGTGPLVGIDGSFDIGSGFSILGHFDAGILVGNIEDHLYSSFVTTSTGLKTTDLDVSAGSQRRVVPVADARLGVAYLWDLGSDSTLGFELGYQASVYHDAIDKINDESGFGFSLAGGGSFNAPTRSSSSLGLNGPYLNVVWRI